MTMHILTPTEARRDLRRSPALRRALRANHYDPDVVAGLSAERIRETLQCIMVGAGVHAGMSVMAGKGGAEFAWDGNTNVTAFLADSPYITLAGSDVAVWTSQQAYTIAGASTTFTLEQSDTGADPLWEPTGLNGDGSIRFEKSAGEWLGTTDADFIALMSGDDTPITVIELYEIVSSASGDEYWFFGDLSVGNSFFRHIHAGANHRIDREDDAGTLVTAAFNPVSTGIQLITTRFEGTQVRFYKDDVEASGSPAAMDTGTLNNTDAFTLCARRFGSATASNFSDARRAGLWFVRNDDTTAIQQIEDYALARGGL